MTVLYPFVLPDRIGPRLVEGLAEAVGSVSAFEVTLARLSWFGNDMLWLAPEPDHPFRALTAAVWRRFPDHPPYGWAHAVNVPHLTIGHDAPAAVLRATADAIRPFLPIRANITTVYLMQGSADTASWHTVAGLPLAPAADKFLPPSR